MRAILATTCMVTGALLAGGCATKKYVRNTTAPIQAKVDQVGEQTTQNSQQIHTTQDQVKQVDDRAQSGIDAASEKASTADQHASDAMNKASQADRKADKNSEELTALRGTVANIDDYKLRTSATVPFKFNQYRLSQDAQQDLDKLAQDIQSNKRFFVAVEGYTDKIGNKEYNEALSRRRADAGVEYLVAKHDVPIYRIHTIGLGEEKPVDDAATRQANARNRRVEVKVFSADQVTASLEEQNTGTASRAEPDNR